MRFQLSSIKIARMKLREWPIGLFVGYVFGQLIGTVLKLWRGEI